jgi:hypothetical protein
MATGFIKRLGLALIFDSSTTSGWDVDSIHQFEQLLVHFGKDFSAICAQVCVRITA